ncbi:MAG: hypothetical protein E6J44_04515 [Chloroflexi bacterium]|nr:MAG: hypothetical protein E6J44_04515 [Chloroflexota bacterium]
MNITTGGPHILLFERDQQLVVLLTSELQLAGYECHAARTAVEVFDAIARYPVRLVLVDLAQAAATRREFWVALDTQRRGRGVQVLTFHCTNIAGYGPLTEDVEERSQTVPADIEMDGMLGIMNMVNAIRSRLAVSNSATISRLSASASSTSSIGGQVTAPLPSVMANNSNQIDMGTLPTSSSQPPVPPATIAGSPSSPTEVQRTAAPNFTDKIRAVIYPNQRSWRSPGTSTSRDNNVENGQSVAPGEQPTPTNPSPPADPFVTGQARRPMDGVTSPKESGLAQLSRMLQEQRSPMLEDLAQGFAGEQENQFLEESTQQQRVRQADATPISAMPLRASPIQDLPTDRLTRGQSDLSSPNVRRPNEAAHLHSTHFQSSPMLMSINTPASTAVSAPQASSPSLQKEESQHSAEAASNTQRVLPEKPSVEEYFSGEGRDNGDNDSDRSVPDQVGVMEASDTIVPERAQNVQKAADNAVLLDIVQSLPPMSSPPPQLQVHNGRATRSLGSVLLEGHLVPQNRLEVAQRIQRMLRGVDMNYQLGEILLMFKLLTPDQLLAASLVSYGMITPAQISALGRIRQELHSIGLEYDLENLLILFRILTSEQLREVRASW